MYLPDMIKSSPPWGLALLVVLLTITASTAVALTLSGSSVLANLSQSAHSSLQEDAENYNGNGTQSIAGNQLLWAVDATQRVEPDSTPENSNRIWSATRKEVRLDAMKGENEAGTLPSEGFHLVVNAQSSALSDLDIIPTALTGTAGSISLDKIHLFREAFFEITEVNQLFAMPRIGEAGTLPSETGTFPDALIPFVDPYGSGQEIGIPFDVPAGENQPLWVLVEVDGDTPAGLYEGTLTLRSDGTTLEQVNLVMEVHPFRRKRTRLTLPERASLIMGADVDIDIYAELHGNATGEERDAIVRNTILELMRRGFALSFEYPAIPEYDNASGFDWSEAEAEWELWMNTHQSPMAFTPAIYRSSYAISDPDGELYEQASLTAGSHFDQQARLYFSRLWDDLNARDWAERMYFYEANDDFGHLSDEPYIDPNVATVYDRIRAWADIIRHPDPDQPEKGFPFIVSNDTLLPAAPYADLRGHIDVWDMYIDDIEERPDSYAARLADYPDEELWAVVNTYTDYIEIPATYHRLTGLFAWKYGVTGELYWDTMAWFDENQEYVNPWNHANIAPIWGMGAGALFWPGYDIEQRGININGPLPSLRLELNSQGIEDYEYLQLLKNAGLGDLADSLTIAALPTKLRNGLPADRDRYERFRRAALEQLSSAAWHGTKRGQAQAIAPTSGTTTIIGTVQTTDSDPIYGTVVGNGTFAALTDVNGVYTLTLPAGSATLNAIVLGYIPATQSLTANQTTADFTLTPVTTNVTPLYGSFESDDDLWQPDYATVERSTQYATDGSYSMHVIFSEAGTLPSEAVPEDEASIINPPSIEPSADWSGFDALEFDLYNASSWVTPITVQIYDRTNLGVDENLYSDPGTWRHVRIPLTNMPLDLSNMDYFAIYADSRNKGDREIYFDNFRLTTVTGPDQSAPGAPTDLTATTGQALRATGTLPWVELTWQAPTEDADGGELTGVQRYEILRGASPPELGGIEGGRETPETVINAYHVTTDPTFRDLEVRSGETWTYAVRAVDFDGHVGAASSQVEVTVGSDNQEQNQLFLPLIISEP